MSVNKALIKICFKISVNVLLESIKVKRVLWRAGVTVEWAITENSFIFAVVHRKK